MTESLTKEQSKLLYTVDTELYLSSIFAEKVLGEPVVLNIKDIDALDDMISSSFEEYDGIDACLSLGYKLITSEPFDDGNAIIGTLYMLYESERRGFGLEKHKNFVKDLVSSCMSGSIDEKFALKAMHERVEKADSFGIV